MVPSKQIYSSRKEVNYALFMRQKIASGYVLMDIH